MVMRLFSTTVANLLASGAVGPPVSSTVGVMDDICSCANRCVERDERMHPLVWADEWSFIQAMESVETKPSVMARIADIRFGRMSEGIGEGLAEAVAC